MKYDKSMRSGNTETVNWNELKIEENNNNNSNTSGSSSVSVSGWLLFGVSHDAA